MRNKALALIVTTLLVSACSSTPQRKATPPSAAPSAKSGGYLAGDGPGTDIPVNLDAVPDPVPKVEPLHRYANRPYNALGKTYTPLRSVGNYKERGIASWYGKKFNGERTSDGETYDMFAMSAAHTTLPLPSYARVTNLSNQKSVIVRVNDRGPFVNDRIIDLSYTAAYKLGILGDGSAEVEVESIDPNVSVNTIAPNTVQSQPLESNPIDSKPLDSAPASSVAAAPPVAVTSVEILPVAATPPVAPVPLENKNTDVYLQLGAFMSQQNADNFLARMRTELASTGKQFKLSTTKDGLVRVHMGPYTNQSEARSSAESLQGKLGFKPMVNLP